MKILLSITLALLGFTAKAQWVNTNTGQYASMPPTGAWINGNWFSNLSSNLQVQIGWLEISNTVAPSPGWVTTSNAVVPYVPINGWCYLLPAASNNIQAVFNAAITNSYQWNAGFTQYLGIARSVQRSYTGYGSETNDVVNYITSTSYFATNTPFLASPTNVFNAIFLNQAAVQIDQLPGITNTAQFYWWVYQYGIF